MEMSSVEYVIERYSLKNTLAKAFFAKSPMTIESIVIVL
jgi:hypothetical protein